MRSRDMLVNMYSTAGKSGYRAKRAWQFGSWVQDSGVGGGAGGYGSGPADSGYGAQGTNNGYGPVVNAEPEPQCCTCQQGKAGPPGPPGDDGKDGNDGSAGNDAKNGKDGGVGPSDGLQSEPCMICPPGAQGLGGAPGAKGPQGPRGSPGLSGVDGRRGEPGMSGPAGTQGEPGPQGPPGKKGDDGRVINVSFIVLMSFNCSTGNISGQWTTRSRRSPRTTRTQGRTWTKGSSRISSSRSSRTNWRSRKKRKSWKKGRNWRTRTNWIKGTKWRLLPLPNSKNSTRLLISRGFCVISINYYLFKKFCVAYQSSKHVIVGIFISTFKIIGRISVHLYSRRRLIQKSENIIEDVLRGENLRKVTLLNFFIC